jgi:hypothetical protein
VDRRVEAQAALLPTQDLTAFTFLRRVLDHDVGKQLHDRAIEIRVGDEIDSCPTVIRLQVEDTYSVGRRKPLHKGPVPVVFRIELELELWFVAQPSEGVRTRRDDEAHGPMLPSEGRSQQEAALAQREVEGRALECPTTVLE